MDRYTPLQIVGIYAAIVAFLRGAAKALPVSIVDAMEAGIAALALDEARLTGRVVDLSETWERFDTHGLRG